jgi:hypothetical protein
MTSSECDSSSVLLLSRRMATFDFSPRMRPVILAGIAMIAAACASAGGTSARRTACNLGPRDSVLLAGGPVYRDCAVDRAARRLTSNVHPDFRPTTPRSGCYSADVEFVVDASGMPEIGTARVVRANDQGFAGAVLATLTRWKYDPAVRDQRPVRQIVTSHEVMSMVVVVAPAGSPRHRGPLDRATGRRKPCYVVDFLRGADPGDWRAGCGIR